MAQTQQEFEVHINNWCNSSKTGKALYKGASIYKIITILLQVLLLIIPVIIMSTTFKSVSGFGDALNKAKQTLELSRMLVIVGSAVGIAGAFWYIIDIISTYKFGRWMHKNNVNALPELMKCVNNKLGMQGKARFRKTATAAGIDKNKKLVTLNVVCSLLRMACSIILAIAVITFIANAIIGNMISMLGNKGIDIMEILNGWKPFAILMGVALFLRIASIIVRRMWKKECFSWINTEVSKAYNAKVEEEQDNSNKIGA